MMCLTGLIVLPENATAMAPQNWQNETALKTNSGLGVAVSGPDNQIYIFGGWSGIFAYSNHAVRYDPVTGTSTNLTPLPKALDSPVAAYFNGNILVAGGRISGGTTVATLYQYDVQNNTWSVKASMLKGVYRAMGAIDNTGKLWVAGGFNSTDNAPTNTVQIYDPSANSWTTGTPLPAARYAGVGFKADGNLYIAGGIDGGSTVLSSVYSIPMNGSAWTAKAGMPSANAWMGAALGKDNQAYVMGGSPSAGGFFTSAVSSTFVYNPDSDTWMSGPALPEKVIDVSATSTSDGSVWRIGGVTDSSLVSKNVSALTVMTVTQTISPSAPIGTGRALTITVSADMAFRSLASFQGTAVLVNGTGSAYASQSFTSVTSSTVHIEMTVPQLAPAGAYQVAFIDTRINDVNGTSFDPGLNNISFSVVSVASTQDQITALQASLAQAQRDGNASGAQITALQSQIAGLQRQLASLQGNNTDLKTAVDSKGDGGLGILSLVLALIAFVLVVLLLVIIIRKNNGKLF
jgi:N-acetylneuraminic acid mutarotase